MVEENKSKYKLLHADTRQLKRPRYSHNAEAAEARHLHFLIFILIFGADLVFGLGLDVLIVNKQMQPPSSMRVDERKRGEDVMKKIIGDFGPWQLRLSLMTALLKFPIAWYQLDIIFLAPPTEFWCKKPEFCSSYTDDQWRKMSVPVTEENACLIFDPVILQTLPNLDRGLIPLVKCENFEYNLTVFSRTIITEWDLVCDKQWMVHFTQIVIMFGVLLGSILFGIISDKYGRKSPLMISIVIQSLMGYVTSFMPTYWWFIFSKFMLSLASGGVGIISFVLIIEVVGGKWRTIIPVLYQLPFGLGNPVMTALAWWFRNWRKLQLSLATLSGLFILYYFYLDESPRWLLATGNTAGAYAELKKAARINKLHFNKNEVKIMLRDAKGRPKCVPGMGVLLKSRNLRLKSILLSINWFFTGLGFYVLSQYLGMIGDNIFLSVMLTGLISTIGPIICVFIIMKMGRRITLTIFEVSTGVCFIGILMIPKDMFTNDWPRLVFAGIGFACMAASVPVLYLYSGELYPTLGRNVGVSMVSTFARIGSMAAPVVVSLYNLEPHLPLIIIATASFCQVLLLLPLPETMNRPLPDTIEEAELLDQYKP